ncbi:MULTISPECIES: hypothetical protein [unclassified Streptomyces]|uniref:hypothetical protein n=1 Tax=unclassified Streptomyces TaxID=2593676 RepID=UPI0036E14559
MSGSPRTPDTGGEITPADSEQVLFACEVVADGAGAAPQPPCLDHPGPKPGRSYAELVGGPLDGLLLDITGWRPEEIDDGVSLLTDRWDRRGGTLAGRPGV